MATAEQHPWSGWTWGRLALVTAPLLVIVGSLIGYLSNSGYSNDWFAGLEKPWFMPPGWLFGVAWTLLYTLMGIALAIVLTEQRSRRRRTALIFFFAQLALNFSWSPIFFGSRMVDIGFVVILLMLTLAAYTAFLFLRIRLLAGYLLVPYLAWLCLAAALNAGIGSLNPHADSAPIGIFGD